MKENRNAIYVTLVITTVQRKNFGSTSKAVKALKHWNGWNILTMYLMNFLRSEIFNISTTVIIRLLDSR